MPTARSYEAYPIDGEPFKESGRMYVNVVTTKGLKRVRWYTDAEYKRMYPDAPKAVSNVMDFNARHAFGFDEKGYITLYKGQNIERWAERDRTNIWYNLTFGYYTPSKFPTPKVLKGVEPVQLRWEEVQDHDDRMKPHEEVRKYVDSLLNQKACITSVCQGDIGTWIERDLAVSENRTIANHFGEKHIHTMIDANGNIYQWETGAKNYEVGKAMRLKMKVKEHEDDGITVVWYCKEL